MRIDAAEMRGALSHAAAVSAHDRIGRESARVYGRGRGDHLQVIGVSRAMTVLHRVAMRDGSDGDAFALPAVEAAVVARLLPGQGECVLSPSRKGGGWLLRAGSGFKTRIAQPGPDADGGGSMRWPARANRAVVLSASHLEQLQAAAVACHKDPQSPLHGVQVRLSGDGSLCDLIALDGVRMAHMPVGKAPWAVAIFLPRPLVGLLLEVGRGEPCRLWASEERILVHTEGGVWISHVHTAASFPDVDGILGKLPWVGGGGMSRWVPEAEAWRAFVDRMGLMAGLDSAETAELHLHFSPKGVVGRMGSDRVSAEQVLPAPGAEGPEAERTLPALLALECWRRTVDGGPAEVRLHGMDADAGMGAVEVRWPLGRYVIMPRV